MLENHIIHVQRGCHPKKSIPLIRLQNESLSQYKSLSSAAKTHFHLSMIKIPSTWKFFSKYLEIFFQVLKKFFPSTWNFSYKYLVLFFFLIVIFFSLRRRPIPT